jgi:transposase
VQRVEVITGKERRRQWTDEEKRRLVAEAFAPGAVVAHVARRHDVAESCLCGWRKRFAAQLSAPQPEPSG